MDGEGRCHHPMTVCNRCRLILNVYVNELEETATLTALNATLDGFSPIYPGDCFCTTCSARGCKYLPTITTICRKGIQAIPLFTEFLKIEYRHKLEIKTNDYIN
jgi:hypothetical protein